LIVIDKYCTSGFCVYDVRARQIKCAVVYKVGVFL